MIITPKRFPNLLAVLFMAVGLNTAVAADEPQDAPISLVPPFCLEQLAGMSGCELEQLYRQAAPGCVPDGFVRGRAIYCPDARFSKVKNKATQCVWRGKIFDACHATMINQWRGFQAIRATVYEGSSWLDGKPAIILDYRCTSRIWSDVRDEIREVAPGVWLGMMYRNHCPEPKFEMFFALEAPCPAACCLMQAAPPR